jgi:hypothetical protein
MAAHSLPFAVVAFAAACAAAPGVTFYVAADGNDAWSGARPGPNRQRTDGPFATLDRARDEVRRIKATAGLPQGGITVELQAGVYELARPFELTNEDSGTAQARVTYRGRPGCEVRIVGGKVIGDWRPVADPAVLARLDEGARPHVVQADLRAHGITDLGTTRPGPSWAQSEPGLELFFRDEPMTLARWPNDGFVKIPAVLGPTPVDVRGTKGCREGIFAYDGDRPRRWVGEPDLMAHGYWFWDWADQRLRIAAIDTEKRSIALEPEPLHGFGFRQGQWYYVYNALAELDQPGEWYLDRRSGVLYFWPPAPLPSGKAMVSVLPTLVTLSNASYVTLQGLILECARGTAVRVSGGTESRLVGCVVRNIGGWAARLDGGLLNGVLGCDIYATGDGGVGLSGGDRRTLTGAGLYAENNHIHHYSRWNRICRPAISLNGVGNRATHNLIDNAPHQAISFSGNDHLIELNEIHSVCYESNDAGAIYAGRNWTMRGTVIRHNYFHHITGFEGRGCVGVYLDDQFCGTEITGNLFYKVTRAAMIGGGRDCTIANNVFVDCTPATHVDARGLGWAASGRAGLENDLKAMPYREPLWARRYPKLVGILGDDPMAPKGNLIARNICVGGRWGDFEAKAEPMVTFQDNLLDQDPRFADPEHQNFQLKENSPAFKLSFRRIPLERIGVYQDDQRASWPVVHKVRTMAAPLAK